MSAFIRWIPTVQNIDRIKTDISIDKTKYEVRHIVVHSLILDKQIPGIGILSVPHTESHILPLPQRSLASEMLI